MSELTHLDKDGRASMVDVGHKDTTTREAVAEGSVYMAPATLAAIRDGAVPKGDVLSSARIAGIMAAKRTPDLIPLCHPLPLTKIAVDFQIDEEKAASPSPPPCAAGAAPASKWRPSPPSASPPSQSMTWPRPSKKP